MEEKKELETPVQNSETPLGSTEPETKTATPPVESPKPKMNKKVLMIVGVVLLLALAGGGYFLWQNSQKQTTSPIDSPKPTAEAVDPTADWKTYINDVHYYLIKYPQEFSILDVDTVAATSKEAMGNEDQINILPSSKDEFKNFLQLESYDSKSNMLDTLTTNLYQNQKKHFQTTQISDLTKTKLGGFDANEYTFTGQALYAYSWNGVVAEGKYKVIFLEKDGKVFLFYLKDTEVFNQILSTFKFVENSDVKTYTSSNLGISFSYKYKYNDNDTISVKEIGNKIYVYPSTMKPEDGQYVEVFDKKSGDSLKTAITDTILKGYSTSDCIVTETTKSPSGGTSPTSYKFAQIDVPRTGNEELPELSQKAEKCPSPYVAIGGLTYFLMDQNHSSKFVFFSIGQYAIDAGTNQTWQDTVKFN